MVTLKLYGAAALGRVVSNTCPLARHLETASRKRRNSTC